MTTPEIIWYLRGKMYEAKAPLLDRHAAEQVQTWLRWRLVYDCVVNSLCN